MSQARPPGEVGRLAGRSKILRIRATANINGNGGSQRYFHCGCSAELGDYNWSGDRIVPVCIVPSSRRPIGASNQARSYDIDVREFLTTQRNEVIKRALAGDIRKFVEKSPGASWERFNGRTPGSFDHRADILTAWVGQQIAPVNCSGSDPWRFPDETLALRSGDCEDRALLLASLLIASGVSSYNVRVALGVVVIERADGSSVRRDHVWVMYKREAGAWIAMEPGLMKVGNAGPENPGQRSRPSVGSVRSHSIPAGERQEASLVGRLAHAILRTRYQPEFVFNNDHLWEVVGPQALTRRRPLRERWGARKPVFAGEAHASIIQESLARLAACPLWILEAVNRMFIHLPVIGRVVDAPDNFMETRYDPRDHFDNGYVAEGWARVDAHLSRFSEEPAAHVADLAFACHGIADFYAHSTFMHFAKINGTIPSIYDPANPASALARSPIYRNGSDFDLTSPAFTVSPHWTGTREEAAATAEGKIISGRYGQPDDAHDPLEHLIQIPEQLCDDSFQARLALPHHVEIAVDEPSRPHNHFYPEREYGRQFYLRRKAAALHIQKAFLSHWLQHR